MRRLVKSFATIWPVSPASRSPRRHSYTASIFEPSKPSLAQRAHFFGGATGISRRWFFTLVSTKNHYWRKFSTFFVTSVMAFSPLHAMGM